MCGIPRVFLWASPPQRHHKRLIHRIDELVNVAERQPLILVGASDAFEEAESLHLVLNRDLRDVESNALICGKISRRGRSDNRLHTLLTKPLRLPAPVTGRAASAVQGQR